MSEPLSKDAFFTEALDRLVDEMTCARSHYAKCQDIIENAELYEDPETGRPAADEGTALELLRESSALIHHLVALVGHLQVTIEEFWESELIHPSTKVEVIKDFIELKLGQPMEVVANVGTGVILGPMKINVPDDLSGLDEEGGS